MGRTREPTVWVCVLDQPCQEMAERVSTTVHDSGARVIARDDHNHEALVIVVDGNPKHIRRALHGTGRLIDVADKHELARLTRERRCLKPVVRGLDATIRADIGSHVMSDLTSTDA